MTGFDAYEPQKWFDSIFSVPFHVRETVQSPRLKRVGDWARNVVAVGGISVAVAAAGVLLDASVQTTEYGASKWQTERKTSAHVEDVARSPAEIFADISVLRKRIREGKSHDSHPESMQLAVETARLIDARGEAVDDAWAEKLVASLST
jgi:hypothetical protein